MANPTRVRTATLDTNVFPERGIIDRAAAVGIVATAITVTAREVEGHSLEAEVAALRELVPEAAVWNESGWDQAVWAADHATFERALRILSNGAFPDVTARDHLTPGQQRQLRDAIILTTHVENARDILVSNDRRAFINGGRREQIEQAFGTLVRTVEEFEREFLT